jgi:hypothetical protein
MTIQLRHSFEPVRQVDPPRSLIWRFRTPRKVREARARREWEQEQETGRDKPYTPLHRGRSRWDRLLRRRQW